MTDAAHIAVHAAKYTSGSSVPLPPTPPTPGPPAPPKHPTYCTQGAGKGKCKNVLYFVSDDMRSDWHTYGLPVVTPNLDKLAAKSLLFEHAYCQLSVCAPSRMSFMMSRRPDTNEVWNFIDTNPLNESATPGHFRDHGYITLGLGKTFHQDSGAWNANAYWSVDEQPYYPYTGGKCPHGSEGGGHCMQADDEIYDWHLRNQTIQYLQYATNESQASGRPFYIMAGFRKPHAPWQYPKRMWDLYDSDSIAVATHKTLPKNAPLISWSRQLNVALENGTSFAYDAFDPVPDWVMQDQRHAYYASVSYVDEHVGAILAALDASGMAEDTMVLFHAECVRLFFPPRDTSALRLRLRLRLRLGVLACAGALPFARARDPRSAPSPAPSPSPLPRSARSQSRVSPRRARGVGEEKQLRPCRAGASPDLRTVDQRGAGAENCRAGRAR